MSLFSQYFLSLVPKSRLTFLTPFWGHCSKWGEEFLGLVGGTLGEAEDEIPLLGCASKLSR